MVGLTALGERNGHGGLGDFRGLTWRGVYLFDWLMFRYICITYISVAYRFCCSKSICDYAGVFCFFVTAGVIRWLH